jgi:hypothetical protein
MSKSMTEVNLSAIESVVFFLGALIPRKFTLVSADASKITADRRASHRTSTR